MVHERGDIIILKIRVVYIPKDQFQTLELPEIEWGKSQKWSHPTTRVLVSTSMKNFKELNSGVNQKCPKTAVRSWTADSEFIYSETTEIMLMVLP